MPQSLLARQQEKLWGLECLWAHALSHALRLATSPSGRGASEGKEEGEAPTRPGPPVELLAEAWATSEERLWVIVQESVEATERATAKAKMEPTGVLVPSMALVFQKAQPVSWLDQKAPLGEAVNTEVPMIEVRKVSVKLSLPRSLLRKAALLALLVSQCVWKEP